MKLRIQDNTVRFRLLPHEIACLCNTGSLSCCLSSNTTLTIPTLHYTIYITDKLSPSSYTLSPGVIAVDMCRTDLIQLRDTPVEQIIIQSPSTNELTTAKNPVTIYVEKDRRPAQF